MDTLRSARWGWWTVAMSAIAFLSACGDSGTGLGERELAFVEVTPPFGRVFTAGDSVAFTATGVFDDGSRGPVEVTWASQDPSIVTMSATGWATAVGDGVTVVEASAGLIVGRAGVLVDPDTIAPLLTNAFVDFSAVSVFQRTATIRLDVHLEDSGSGLKSALAFFTAPTGSGATGLVTLLKVEDPGAPPSDLTVFQGVLAIPANTGVGTWTLSLIQADDKAGNVGRWGTLDLEALGLTVEIVATLSR